MIFGYSSLPEVGDTAGQKKPESDNFVMCPHHTWTPTSPVLYGREIDLTLSKPPFLCPFCSLSGNLKPS